MAKCYDFQIDTRNQRRWDDSVLSKEEAAALFMSRKGTMLKRELMKE